MALKLLLITHDPVLAKAYRAHLTRAGFDVEHCSIGHEGLAKARRWNPDLIILDLVLPGLHGLDVLKWLRDVPWLVKVPVILLIERTLERAVLDECVMWGAGSFLHKDVCTLQELVAHVHATLQPGAPPPLPTSEPAANPASPQ